MTHQHAHGGRRCRHGTCHRCGWRGHVAKITRRERRAFAGDRTFTRLCDECILELLHGRPEVAHKPQPSRRRSVGSRDVA